MLLRQSLLALSRSEQIKNLIASMPVSSGVVARFVAGEGTEDAVRASRELASEGLFVTMDHLGEDTLDRDQAEQAVQAYVALFEALQEADLTAKVEASVKLSAVGQSLDADGERVALDNARRICQAASNAGTTVTLDMEDHTTTDSTLGVLRELRQDFPSTGAVLQAQLRRTEADASDLATTGSRVRLCKGAYKEPESAAYQDKGDVDLSYVRCLKALVSGSGYPMVATHDPRLIDIAESLLQTHGREADSYEFQMLYGIRPDEQKRLADKGHATRIYVPYGQQWYGYLMRRLAERPANLTFFARSLVTRS